MTKLSDLNPSNFLKPKDIPRDGLELTIRRIEKGTLTDARTKQTKTVYTVHWQEAGVKPLTLNKVNVNTLIAKFGDLDVDAMAGKVVNVIRVWGEAFGKAQWLIRIEPPDEIGDEAPEGEETPGSAAPGEGEIPF